jgi:NTP pyrophosphatase (non-canonical NTP hydrolase)
MSTNQANKTNAFDRYQEAAGRTFPANRLEVLERIATEPELLPLINAALGLAGEAGEIADHVKKVVFHGHKLDVEYLLKECGDEFWYLAYAAHALKVKLSKIPGMNIEKLKKRYPEGFDENRSINREE